MGATSVMLLQGANTATQFLGQRQQAGAVLAQGTYTQNIANWNAHIADMQAKDALERGGVAATRQGVQTRALIGAQRAAAAAQGIDANSGSAVDLQAGASKYGVLDELTIRNNAAREALGYQVSAADQRLQGAMAEQGGQEAASALRTGSWSTLLTGAAQTYSFYKNSRTSKGPKAPAGTQLPDAMPDSGKVYG